LGTLAVAASPKAIVGAPPSTRIAVKGGGPSPSAFIPEPASTADAVSDAVRFVQSGDAPASRVTGSARSTRSTARPLAADFIPEPETATACR
jgi:hypothetical protein